MPPHKRDEHPRSAGVTGQVRDVTRREHRAGSWYFSQKSVTVQGGYGTPALAEGGVFLPSFSLRSLGEGGPDTNLIEHYACRDTILIGATRLS